MKKKMFSLPTKCQTLAGMMMTAILVCGLTVLTACSTTDDPATPQPTGVTGQWISYEEKSGEITDDELPYDCIARVLQFNADGTGFCELYYLMDETMVFGDANRYGDDAQLTYTIAGNRVDYTMSQQSELSGSLTLTGETLTDEATGRVYEQAGDDMTGVTEYWAAQIHGGADASDSAKRYLLKGTSGKADASGLYKVTDNPANLSYTGLMPRFYHRATFELAHGGTISLRAASIAEPGRSAKPSPIIRLDANEELTFILSGCNALKTDGIDIRIIDTKGSIKLKGHGFLYLMGAKDGLLGEGDDYDFSKLAADGYTVERTREDFGYMYTVYKKDIVDMKDVTPDHVGYVIASDGKVYPTHEIALRHKVTPLGMIAYVGKGKDYQHGLAVFTEQTVSTTLLQYAPQRVETFAKTKPAPAGCTWRLPTRDEVKLMFDACSCNPGETPDDRGRFAASGFIDMNRFVMHGGGTGYYFVTSDKSADGNSIWVYDFNQGTFLEKSNKSWSFRVLPCLAF